MCRIMTNPASRDLIFGFKNRNESLQRIRTLTREVENNEREIANIDKDINTAENIIKDAEKTIDAHKQVMKNTEALIANNEELINCYKALIANNEAQSNITVNIKAPPTTEERSISITAYEKAKQDIVDLNLDLKTNKQLIKIIEKIPVTTNESVDDSKLRMTAYNILNDCFNNFRIKHFSSMRWF